jgi:hypothetical protein
LYFIQVGGLQGDAQLPIISFLLRFKRESSRQESAGNLVFPIIVLVLVLRPVLDLECLRSFGPKKAKSLLAKTSRIDLNGKKLDDAVKRARQERLWVFGTRYEEAAQCEYSTLNSQGDASPGRSPG